MEKPLSQYVNNKVPEVAKVEALYGSNLEQMTQNQKIHLSNVIAQKLINVFAPLTDNKFREICIAIANGIITKEDAIALLKELVNSL